MPFCLYWRSTTSARQRSLALFASRSLGLTRKEVRLREGRYKTAPMVVDGVVGQKTVVLMLDLKNNWRQVEVKINGTFGQGWVPESTITRLRPELEKPYFSLHSECNNTKKRCEIGMLKSFPIPVPVIVVLFIEIIF